MDQEIEIINTNTRIEKIKNYFVENKFKIISFLGIILVIVISIFFYIDFKKNLGSTGPSGGNLVDGLPPAPVPKIGGQRQSINKHQNIEVFWKLALRMGVNP